MRDAITRGNRTGCSFLPQAPQETHAEGVIRCQERLGGLLKYYQREAV
jgi:hypothetical protein